LKINQTRAVLVAVPDLR